MQSMNENFFTNRETNFRSTQASRKHADSDSFNLKLKVRASLFTGKSTVHLSNRSENSDIHPYDFFLGAWMGGSNEKMEYTMLKGQADGTGIASINLPIYNNDSDFLKLGVYIRDPETKIMRHINSGYKHLLEVATSIDGVSHPDHASDSLLLKDNYSKNQTLIHFANDGTDVEKFKVFCAQLQPSILHQNELLNQKVIEMSFGLHNWIEKSSCVSNMNGGPNFVNSICFLESMGCAINYPLLDMTYSSERHRAPLSMLAYQGLATLRYVNHTADELMAMPDHQFVQKFVVPLCKSFTICPNTMVYSGDKTIDPAGNLDMATEDFAMVMSQHLFCNAEGTYHPARKIKALREMKDSELQETIQSLRAGPVSDCADHHVLISDDCETLAGMIKSVEGGIHKGYMVASADAGDDSEVASKYSELLWESTRDMGNLSSVPRSDFDALGKLLTRYGKLRQNHCEGKAPCSQIGVSIVSAKGASFAVGKTDLNGHACTISQTLGSRGEQHYMIGEGTANMTMRSVPGKTPERVTLMMNTGEKGFGTIEALNCINQYLADCAKTGEGKIRLEQNIPGEFQGKDPYKSCPFYMAGFFVGLQMGQYTPGIIPLQAQNAGVDPRGSRDDQLLLKGGELSACDPGEDLVEKAVSAAEQRSVKRGAPIFGAPIVDLSGDNVSALPIDMEKVMGAEGARLFMSQLKARNDEVYPPRASEETLKRVMSRWVDLEPLSVKNGFGEIGESCVLSSAEGFACADMARVTTEYKKRLARKFNSLQAEDPMNDGILMDVHGQMLSAVVQFKVPLPLGEKWHLSCARNMRKAVELLPFRSGGTGGVGSVSGQFVLI